MIMTPVHAAPTTIAPARALIVGLALIPLTLVVIASLPALVVMPFMPKGTVRIEMLVKLVSDWSVSIMTHSRAAHELLPSEVA